VSFLIQSDSFAGPATKEATYFVKKAKTIHARILGAPSSARNSQRSNSAQAEAKSRRAQVSATPKTRTVREKF
jgi:hypothetical protein